MSFAEFWQRAHRFAGLLRDRYGVRRGDRRRDRASQLPSGVMIACAAAAVSAGAIAVAMNALWTPRRDRSAIDDLRAQGSRGRLGRLERLSAEGPALSARRARRAQPIGLAQRDAVPSVCRHIPQMPRRRRWATSRFDDDAIMLYDVGIDRACEGRAVDASGRAERPPLLGTRRRSGGPDGHRENAPSAEKRRKPPPCSPSPCFMAHRPTACSLSKRSARSDASSRCTSGIRPLAATLIRQQRVTSLIAPAAVTGDLGPMRGVLTAICARSRSSGAEARTRAPEQGPRHRRGVCKGCTSHGLGTDEDLCTIGAGLAGPTTLAHLEARAKSSAVTLELRIVAADGLVGGLGVSGESQVRGASLRGLLAAPGGQPRGLPGRLDAKTGDVSATRWMATASSTLWIASRTW